MAAVAMVVAAIWHTNCAGSGGGDGYCNRKEGEQSDRRTPWAEKLQCTTCGDPLKKVHTKRHK